MSSPKNKGGRPKKDLAFEEEKQQVLDKLFKIIGITDDNKIFYFTDIENDENKQKEILDLENDVKLYFNYSGFSYFSKKLDRPYLSLAKSIMKSMNVKTEPISIIAGTSKKVLKSGVRIIS